MIRRGPLSAALILTFLWLFSAPVRAAVFNPESFTLENGLQVVVVSDHRVPVVTHMLWYRVGAADEAAGESGIAHFLEHLMFKGTKTVGPGEFSALIQRHGGRENAFTSQDYTGYYQTVASDRLESMMRHEADRMTNLTLSEEHVVAERDVVLEERRSRTDNNPSAQLSEAATAATYLAYPYRLPIIGWEAEIRQLSREHALAFYRRWYAPNNAVMVLAGDVTVAQARVLAERHYGPIVRKPVPDRVALRGGEPPQLAARQITLRNPRVGQPSWSRRYLTPSYAFGASEHAYALQVLSEILGGGTTSRLYRKLVVTDKIAVSAGAWYDPSGLGPTQFGFYASPAQGHDLNKMASAMQVEIDQVVKDGVAAEEVAGAIKRMTAAAIYARDSVTAPARLIGAALMTGQSLDDIEAWPERISAVTAAQIAVAAKAVFIERQSVTTRLLRGVVE